MSEREPPKSPLRRSAARRRSRRRFAKPVLPNKAPSADATQHQERPCEGSPADADGGVRLRGERRQVSVLFCDLVGSTELAEKLDPEELCQLMRFYQVACGQAIAPFGGYLAQTLGDGILVYFGFPKAYEDDAVRAVRAGLAAIAAVADHEGPLNQRWSRCAARAGIHTGVVYAGEVGPFDTRSDRALIGDVPNIAARLQSLAGINEVLVGPTTRKLLGDLFTIEALGPHALKGLSVPLDVFRVLSAAEPETRFAGRASGLSAPLVGRDSELSNLKGIWEQACAGRGQTVLLSGVAGIGKSRLAEALRAEVADSAHVLVHQCSAYFQNSALHPFVSHLWYTAGLEREDSDEQKWNKIQQLFDATQVRREREMPLIARLLGIPTSDVDTELQRASAQRVLEDTLDLLEKRILKQCRDKPLLVLFEDAHWADPLTRRVLVSLSRSLISHPIMLLVTDRGEFIDLSSRRAVTTIHLPTLPKDATYSLIGSLLASATLGRQAVEAIAARSEGIPFFIEELTRAVLETPGDRSSRVPSSLAALLTVRLDSLGPYKAIAQRAACLGTKFTHPMLEFVTGLDPHALARGVDALVAADLLSCVSTAPTRRYAFRHSLLQDAAYESMLLQERRETHLAIARKVERDFPERVVQEPEVLAHHYQGAGDYERACRYWVRAGHYAQERSAHANAIGHLASALEALAQVERTREEDLLEIEIQASLARSRLAAEAWGGERVYAAYSRALELCAKLRNQEKERDFWWGICVNLSTRGALAEAGEKAQEYVDFAERKDDHTALQMAHNAALLTTFCQAELDLARHHGEGVRKHYREPDGQHWLGVSMHEPLVLGSVYESLCLWVQGHPDRSLQLSTAGIARARKLDHPFQLCHALLNGSLVRILRREHEPALQLVDEALKVANDARIPIFHVYGPLMASPALLAREPSFGTVRWLEACYSRFKAADVLLHVPLYLGHVARAYLDLGDLRSAMGHVEDAIATVGATNERWVLSELQRIKAAIMTAQDPVAPAAEQQLKVALREAQRTGAHGFELRIIRDLALLLERLGRRHEVENLVADKLSTLKEGLQTADVMEIRAFLQGD